MAVSPSRSPDAPQAGELTDELLETCTWTDEMLEQAGIPVVDTPFLTVGGGFGSFAMVDFLRVAGVPAEHIRVLSPIDKPYATYRYLAEASQIFDDDRLRSDSMTQMGNLWGFPSYALREAWAEKRPGPLWTVLTEPILSEFFNPKAKWLYADVDREAARINWTSMLVAGTVRMVRKREAGGYFALLTPPAGTSPTKRVAYRTRYAHVAVGYPSLRFLPDLQAYRATYNDYHHVVNAYEPHTHVYQALRNAPGTVVVRGAGIVASRILERLLVDRERHGAQTQVVHLFRTYVDGPRGPLRFRRRGGNGFTYQAFTFVKAAGGGQMRFRVLELEGRERADFIKSMGGTTTAKRREWQRQLERARRDGSYRTEIGEVAEVVPGRSGKVVTRLRERDGSTREILADYIIDATGLEGDVRDHRLLADLLACGGAGTNPIGRIDVAPDFEVRGTASGDGRLYASGTITLGGYLAPVDSFWGVQHAALSIADSLAARGFGSRIGALRSTRQWWRWLRKRQP